MDDNFEKIARKKPRRKGNSKQRKYRIEVRKSKRAFYRKEML